MTLRAELANIVENELDRQLSGDKFKSPDFDRVGTELVRHLKSSLIAEPDRVLADLDWSLGQWQHADADGDIISLVVTPPQQPTVPCALCGKSYQQDPTPGPPVAWEHTYAHRSCAADAIRERA